MSTFETEIQKHVNEAYFCLDEIKQPSCRIMSEKDYFVYMANLSKNLKNSVDILENMFRTVAETDNDTI